VNKIFVKKNQSIYKDISDGNTYLFYLVNNDLKYLTQKYDKNFNGVNLKV
jgi:hypothetical protein